MTPTSTALRALSSESMTGYVVKITPEMAGDWLDSSNHDNRSIRKGHVSSLAAEINKGLWKATHQGIAFSKTGRLVDGQHRLKAIIEADRPTVLTVFTDLNDDMFGVLDRGANRSIRDELKLGGQYADPCSFISAFAAGKSPGNSKRIPAEVAAVVLAYQDELREMVEASGQDRTGRTAAPYRAALIVRLKDASTEGRRLLLDQYRFFVTQEYTSFDSTTAAFQRRIAVRKNIRGVKSLVERAAIAWQAWDPLDRDRKILQDRGVDEMRKAAIRHLAPWKDNAPTIPPEGLTKLFGTP
jgi:hypothetical protein